MPVTALDGASALHVDPKRRAIERLFRVVDRQRVACEEDVDVAAPDQVAEIGAAAGVDDDGAGDEGDPIAGGFRGAHHGGDLRDPDFHAPLG